MDAPSPRSPLRLPALPSLPVPAHDGDGGEAVFHVHHVSKIYTMGEVRVRALNAVVIDLYRGELAVILGAS